MFTLSTFYNSPEWKNFRKTVISERLSRDGDIICEHCKKPILNSFDIIAHHSSIYLTESNVNDYNISLNPDNIQLVHHKCHNTIHDKFGHMSKKIYVVFGSPGSGKSTYVNSVAEVNSLIVDIDRIYESINNNRSGKLYSNVMQIFNQLLDMVQTRNGQWSSAYIVVANCRNVERLVKRFDAEVIFIDTDYDTCIKQAQDKITKYGEPYKKAIDTFHQEWNETYSKLIVL